MATGPGAAASSQGLLYNAQGKEGPTMTIAELADALTAQGIEVRGVLHQECNGLRRVTIIGD